MKETHIILIAHGSKDPRWRKPFENLEKDLKSTSGNGTISLAYMEFISPSLIDVISENIDRGISNLKVLPLFMAGGGHVDKNIPELIREAKKKFPQAKIEQLPPIGENPKVVELTKEVIMSYLK